MTAPGVSPSKPAFRAPGPVALVGSGEFLPVMATVDAGLLDGRTARAVIIPTASAPEGTQVFNRWMTMGVKHFTSLGVEPVPLAVTDRRSADDPGLAAQLAGSGLVYLSGGNPAFLTATLRGTRVWTAIVEAWRGGAALAGCSAGAMALSARAPDPRVGVEGEGLGLVAHLAVIPHFDRMSSWRPELAGHLVASVPAGQFVVGIDEDTALVGGPDQWTVAGRQGVWLLSPAGRQRFGPGERIELPAVGPGATV